MHRCNVRASLLQSPIPLSGFNYQPVFLESEDAKCLHNPLLSKSGRVKTALTSKTSLFLKKKNKTIKTDAFNNDFQGSIIRLTSCCGTNGSPTTDGKVVWCLLSHVHTSEIHSSRTPSNGLMRFYNLGIKSEYF